MMTTLIVSLIVNWYAIGIIILVLSVTTYDSVMDNWVDSFKHQNLAVGIVSLLGPLLTFVIIYDMILIWINKYKWNKTLTVNDL